MKQGQSEIAMSPAAVDSNEEANLLYRLFLRIIYVKSVGDGWKKSVGKNVHVIKLYNHR